MKKLTLIAVLLSSIIWSCGDDEVVKDDPKLAGHWQLDHSLIGSAYILHPMVGPIKYHFNDDGSFIKDLGTPDWRDEGTWTYNDADKALILSFKTHSTVVSDTQTVALVVYSVSDTLLVLQKEYNDTNPIGEFAEFEYIYCKRE